MKNRILEGGEIWMFNHLLMVEEILGRKRGIVERLKERRSLRGAILKARGEGKRPVIAEVKRRGLREAESEGVKNLAVGADAASVAKRMERGGACAISVLTDEAFLGDLEDLRSVKLAVSVPVLRKDFIFDDFQVIEAFAHGADAVLLIARFLSVDALRSLAETAFSLRMETLVEVDRTSVAKVLSADASFASLIGINNRDLETLEVDLAVFEELAPSLKDAFPDVPLVAMSGIENRKDAERMFKAGADAILVGTAIMKSEDIEGKVRELVGNEA
ncbi:MAG: indole-3-glycerol-phosphate synthase [Candidatus Methanospirare jalkutatii]|nr:MAG: indole-3-glycerol-phosphate synthase [Candidatus Methanospirare jalkutatii]